MIGVPCVCDPPTATLKDDSTSFQPGLAALFLIAYLIQEAREQLVGHLVYVNVEGVQVHTVLRTFVIIAPLAAHLERSARDQDHWYAEIVLELLGSTCQRSWFGSNGNY